jgi:hypothetical protein
MAEPKTKPSKTSVAGFVAKQPESIRADTQTLIDMMEEVSGAPPVLWGSSIIGFDRYTYVYASGKSGDWPIIGLSPRKKNLVVYLMSGFEGADKLLAKLGKHKTGKSCLYVQRVSDLHIPTLKNLMKKSIAAMKKKYPDKK